MAGRRYSAGRIFLQVVPSFDNLQREIGNEVRKANRGLAKEQEELGEELAEARDRGAQKAERAAHERRKTQAKKDAKDLTEAMDALYVDPVILRLKKLARASDQVRIQEIARTTRALTAQRDREFQINEKARAKEREAEAKEHARRVADFQKWTQQSISERLKQLAAAEEAAYREKDVREKALAAQRKAQADHMAWVIKTTLEESKRVAAEEEKARREREQAEAAHERRMEAARDKIKRRRIASRLADLRAAEADRRRVAGGAIGGRIRKGVGAAADAIGTMRIDVDSSAARVELAALRQELLGLGDAEIGVDLDAGDAMARIELISARLKALQSNDAEVDVNANAAAALIALKRVEQQVDQINRKTARGGMLGMFMGAKSSAEDGANSFRVFNYRVLALLVLLPLLPPLLASAAAGIGALATAAVGGVAGIGVLIAGLWGIQDAVSAMGDAQDDAAKDTLAASKTMRNASRAVRDARQGVARTERDVARSIRDALRAQRDAEQDLARAQRDATDAQKDLMDARRQAQREQDDLADRIAGGKLDERQALIDLFNAQVAYNAAMADGGATNLEREEAAIQLERAQLAIKGIRKENADLIAEQKRGASGSQTVIAAQERVVSTQEALADAQQRARDAEEAVTEARVRGAEQVRDAQERLNDSVEAYGEALRQTSEVGSASAEKLRLAMSKLSPEAQAFATFIFGLRGFFAELRATAGAGFLPELQELIEGLITRYGPSFLKFVGSMSESLGRFFIALGKSFESPVMVNFFETMAQYAPVFFDMWGRIGIAFMEIIAGLMTAFAPFAETFMTGFAEMMEGWAEWAATLKDNPAFQQFIAYVIEVGPRVLGLIGDLLQLVINIGIGLADNGMFDAITGFISILADMDPGILAALVGAIIGLGMASQVAAGFNSLVISFMLLTATPIGLVTLGLFAIGAALVLLYQNVEWFREGVNTAWTFVQGLFASFMTWVQENFMPWWTTSAMPVITSVFEAIGAFANWLWFTVLEPFFRIFVEVAGYAFRIISAIVMNVLAPAFAVIGAAIGWLWNNVAWPIFELIGEAFSTMAGHLVWVWDNILSNVFEAIARALEGDFVGAFDFAIRAVEGIWNGLKKIAAGPVNFVIGTVLNDGLFAAFNKVMEFFGSDTRIKPLKLVTWGDDGGQKASSTNRGHQEFYTGGWTGPGSKYQPAGIVHADEFVVRKEATNKIKATYGLDVLDYINRYGDIPMFGAGYAIGGMVKPVNIRPSFPWGRYPSGGRHRALDLAGPAGTPIVSPYPGKIIRDGWDSTGFGNHVRLQAEGGGRGTFWILGHMLREVVRVGQQVAAGQLLGLMGSTGRSTGNHLHLEGRLSPYNPDSAFDFTAAFNGGRSVTPAIAAAQAANLPWWIEKPLSFLKDMVNAGLSKLPNAGLFDDLLRGGINKLMDGAGTFLGNIIGGGDGAMDSMGGSFLSPSGESLAYNGVQAFDAGGLLQPGVTTVLNMTGKPEPVFTNDQWREGPRGAGALIGNLDLDVNGTDLTAHDVVEELMGALTRVSHGGKYAGRAF